MYFILTNEFSSENPFEWHVEVHKVNSPKSERELFEHIRMTKSIASEDGAPKYRLRVIEGTEFDIQLISEGDGIFLKEKK